MDIMKEIAKEIIYCLKHPIEFVFFFCFYMYVAFKIWIGDLELN